MNSKEKYNVKDYNEMLNDQLENLPKSEQIKIENYFNSFISTFSSAYTTSQIIITNKLNLSNSKDDELSNVLVLLLEESFQILLEI